MQLLPLALIAGAAYWVMKNRAAAAPAITVSLAPSVTPSAPDSVIQYVSPIPPLKGSIDTGGASPVEASSMTPGTSLSGLGSIAGGCCSGCGLGAVPADRAALKAQLQAIKANFGPRLQHAITTGDRATIAQLTASMRSATLAALAAYHAANPGDHSTRIVRSVAPVFMAPDRTRRAG